MRPILSESVPHLRRWILWYLSHLSFTAIFYFFSLFFVSLCFMMKHLWLCLSGLSSQFSPTRREYEWLICMWTGAFTSILIETVVACCCVAWFPCAHWRAVKNWKRRQICYPYVALRRPLKMRPFMYNTETFKIIASLLSVLSLFSLSHIHKHSEYLWRKALVIITCNFPLHWQVLNWAL